MERAFHSASVRQVLEELNTDAQHGLSPPEAARRLKHYGENRLAQGKQAGLLLRVLSQLKDPMILVLLAAAALSYFAGGGEDWLDSAIILLIDRKSVV